MAYIASMLKGHEVTVFDANVTRDPLGELSKRLRAKKPRGCWYIHEEYGSVE